MLQNLFGLLYLSAVLQFVSLTGAHNECPIQLNPQSVIVKYNSSVSVNCSTNVPHGGMGWEATEGSVPMTNDSLITWNIQHLRQWDIEPICYINYNNGSQCESRLPITIYKTIDNMSISTVDHTGPMIEGKQYKLQCDIQNVAPVNNLTVKWFKGRSLVNFTTFNDKTKTPVNESATLLITANRTDDGVQYRCEAELELETEESVMMAKLLYSHVNYKPKHSSSLEIISTNGKEVSLNCTVVANPAPTYTWHSKHLQEKITSSVLTSSTLTPGNYTCTATNFLGESSKVFIKSSGSQTTFWAIHISFQLLVALWNVI
ncbi:intercellular adhesion molecule 4-like [Myxocyprinus asiaticus]|uniref:intercellular adhesion molecule 4-like n=1 Tax=Myxocyprinus asiaticus TaxID=70543 RepID=UPI002222FD46|nr:intercellular adhesion molecule 4-like [Myxocyprinus asiaticus]